MSVKVRPLPKLTGSDPDESVDSSNLRRANESVDSSYLRESIHSESVGSDHIRSVKVGMQYKWDNFDRTTIPFRYPIIPLRRRINSLTPWFFGSLNIICDVPHCAPLRSL